MESSRADPRHTTLPDLLPRHRHHQVDGLLEDYAHYRRGEAAAVSSAIAELTGTPPRDVMQFAREYAPAFSDLSGPADLDKTTVIMAEGRLLRQPGCPGNRQPAR
jgi:hypothetical protein